jgi:uncharacterized protein (TIGR02145 family)
MHLLKDFIRPLVLISSISLILCLFCARNTITDADGNTYRTVKIGNQVWIAENYRATKFNDGSPIPPVPDSIAWHSLSTPGYCYYGNTNDIDTIKRFGALYNWYCVGSDKFAPPGWHVATDDDWDSLREYLIKQGYNWDGVKRDNRIAKSLAARSGWKPYGSKGMPGNNTKDNNRSGFSAFAAGCREDRRDSAALYSVFAQGGHRAAWWSGTKVNESVATAYGLGFCVDYLIKYQRLLRTCGYPVRLLKNRK